MGADTDGTATGSVSGDPNGLPAFHGAPAACPNCGTALAGRYCSGCAQPAHLHRSLTGLGHDILHGVLHVDGKAWRTVVELSIHPGRLTRRYIDGERARFVSPMGLFLFSVFLMFAAFSLTGDPAGPDRGVQTRAAGASAGGAADVWIPGAGRRGTADVPRIDSGWPALDAILNDGLRQFDANPRLLLYRLKSNSYKFSWALVPMSLPFMWLLFFWRRDIRVYDHAVFVAYSISFMMLLMVVLAGLAAIGVGSDIRELATLLVPPVHLYRQLRGAYGVSRTGALVRLVLLLASIGIVLAAFTAALLLFGALD